MVKLVIDMLGGDNGVEATVKAVNRFVNEFDDVSLVAVGDKEKMSELDSRVQIIDAKEVAPMECHVLEAMRNKNTSIYKAVEAVKSENADGIISAGSTSALLALTTLIIKK